MITYSKHIDGNFYITVPFAIKDEFKRAFKGVKWSAVGKQWFTADFSESDFAKFNEKLAKKKEKLAKKAEKEAKILKIEADKRIEDMKNVVKVEEKKTVTEAENDGLTDEEKAQCDKFFISENKKLDDELATLKGETQSSKDELNSVLKEKTKENELVSEELNQLKNELFDLIESIISVSALNSARKIMEISGNIGIACEREKWDNGREVINEASNILARIGLASNLLNSILDLKYGYNKEYAILAKDIDKNTLINSIYIKK